MREHHGDERFETQNRNRICRYFKRGFCAKGDQCTYQHKKPIKSTHACNNGMQCHFLKQNRCRFFHPEVGVTNQGFQFGIRKNRPPVWVRDMNPWMDY